MTFLICFFSIMSSFGQSKKQKQLEEKRLRILKDIREVNALISNNKQQSTSLLTKIEDLNLKIKVRKNLIQVTNEQANLLTREIKNNNIKISNLEEELEILKKSYANMVVQTYKSRSKQSKLMFLFSSDNFLQAYKRYNYMKQYKNYQKRQADSIVSKTEQLVVLNDVLLLQQKDKQRLIKENRAAQKTLQDEKKNQQQLIEDLRKDEAKYRIIISKKLKESNDIDKQIDKLIKEAIAKSNKKSGKNNSSKEFAITPESKALSASFSLNKGKLPWPLKTGTVTKKFGKRPHPVFPGITENCSGVEITTSKNSEARAVYKGKVSGIQKIKGGNIGVYIKHGSYVTLYYNLKKVYVKKGQDVSSKDILGAIATNSEGKTILKFYLYKNNLKLNPAHWIYKM